jgi:hypothetical protein
MALLEILFYTWQVDQTGIPLKTWYDVGSVFECKRDLKQVKGI